MGVENKTDLSKFDCRVGWVRSADLKRLEGIGGRSACRFGSLMPRRQNY